MSGEWPFLLLEMDDVEGLRRVLDEDPSCVNLKDQRGCDLLTQAVQQGNVDAVTLLLARGADPNGSHAKSESPLFWALHADEETWRQIASLLIAAGANLESREPGSVPPLHTAVGLGSLEKVRFLLSFGADINARTLADGHTALWVAALLGRTDIAEFLNASGADPSIADTTLGLRPLQVAEKYASETFERLKQVIT